MRQTTISSLIALLCITDMLATFAAVTGQALPNDAGPDSFNQLPALLGQPAAEELRPNLIVQSGMTTVSPKARKDGERELWAVREGKWKLVLGQGAGYSTAQNLARHSQLSFSEVGMANSECTPDGKLKPDAPPGQLYDLSDDFGETKNVYREHPDVVARLTSLFEQLRDAGRSRP